MERKTNKAVQIALTAALTVGVAGVATHAVAKPACKVEKCYGIVKKGKNDCGTPKNACAGQAKVSGSKIQWMYVMKGNCTSIVGGQLKPGDDK